MARQDDPRRGEQGAKPFVPKGRPGMGALAEAVQACRGCDLHERATQAVFGVGPVPADLMLVGEQPGDAEDRQSQPFVGPAGRIFDRAPRGRGNVGPGDLQH